MKTITLEDGQKVKLSDESYEELSRATKKILVPENIKIEWEYKKGDGLGIVFNNNKQTLFYGEDIYKVNKSWKIDFIQCELMPIKKEDLKVGHTYFRTDSKTHNFGDLELYCKYLGNSNYVYCTSRNDVLVAENSWEYWYKVVPAGD